MVWICVFVLAAEFLLALLSRIHFSKYKAAEVPWVCRFPWGAMAERLYPVVASRLPVERLQSDMRKIHVASKERIRVKTKMFVTFVISLLLLGCFVCSLGVLLCFFVEQNQKEGIIGEIEREDYTGDSVVQGIYLTVDGTTELWELELQPRELTYEEFLEQADILLEKNKPRILGDNPDFGHITANLNFRDLEDYGVFDIHLETDAPERLDRMGRLSLEGCSLPFELFLYVEISYLDYKKDYVIPMVVQQPENSTTNVLQNVKMQLEQMEEQSRDSKVFVLPEQLEGVKIQRKGGERDKAKKLAYLGGIVLLLIVPLAGVKQREQIKKRDSTLKGQYTRFVRYLWLLLGAGMTVQRALRYLVSENLIKETLKKEVEYSLHRMEAGCEESGVYEDLALTLSLPEYKRLFMNISQNIRVGTRDLRGLMEEEMQLAFAFRKELARQKGEVASTKLLLPMVMLLLFVLIMIMLPALAGI